MVGGSNDDHIEVFKIFKGFDNLDPLLLFELSSEISQA